MNLPAQTFSVAILLAGAAAAQTAGTPQPGPRTIAHLEDAAVTESSGIAASRANPGIYWTHNDSGNGPVIYAFDRTGRGFGRWTVTGARNVDWEDLAIGPASRASGGAGQRWYLYLGDIGDNDRRRSQVIVYRVPEPAAGPESTCHSRCATARATAIRLRYPDGSHNAETLMVHPASGDLYVITKSGGRDAETGVYVARSRQLGAGRVTLRKIAALAIPEPLYRTFAGGLTGGDISPDGRRVALCDYFRLYEAVLPPGAAFDDIWRQPFASTLIGLDRQVEAVAYRADGRSLIVTSEGRPCPVFEIAVRE